MAMARISLLGLEKYAKAQGVDIMLCFGNEAQYICEGFDGAVLFDSKEQLAVHPEFVDLLAMNQTLMDRWNKLVKPGDKVYVTGEFGNEEWMKLVNGEVQLVDSSADTAPVGLRLI